MCEGWSRLFDLVGCLSSGRMGPSYFSCNAVFGLKGENCIWGPKG